MKNKSLFIKDLFLVITTSLCVLFSLILYISSYSYYDDGFGYDNSFDKDNLILLVISLIIFAYSLYLLVINLKQIKPNKNIYYGTAFSVGLINFCYPLGIFFKKLTKAISNDYEFDYEAYSPYLYVSIIFLAFTLYIVFAYLNNKQNNN